MSDWVIRLIDSTGYAGVFLLMLLETVFPPIPSEVIMPVAGLRAANGPMTLGGVVASGTAGAMAGNLFWYVVARAIGVGRLKRFIERRGRWLALDWCDVEKVERLFGRFGSWVVFAGRMLPTARTMISVPAGFLRMHLARFFLWSAFGTAVWSGALALAGYGLGLQFGRVEEIVGPVSSAIIALIVLGYAWRQVTWDRRLAKRAGGRADTRP
ncbi:MAG TPA: DedA family protein [Allosphingosinicella sp.]|nr:DedA family protein [Allosphingosinicella sp.]